MDPIACRPVIEHRRTATQMTLPQGLACAGGCWISFRGVPNVYRTDPRTSDLEKLCDVPGTAWGLAAHGDRIWAVSGTPPDDGRSVFAFDLQGRRAAEPHPCPQQTGSYLTHDGSSLFLSQWYEKRVFRMDDDGAFTQVATARRGICGIAAYEGKLALLNTDDEESNDYYITLIEKSAGASAATDAGVDIARVPFRGRSLVWTGGRFLTNHREQGEIVEFSVPG
jgi:hypothetical protein